MLNYKSSPTHSEAHVTALFRKEQRGKPMLPVLDEGLSLCIGRGIAQDANQHPMSPRQILVTRQEDLLEFGLQPGDLRENIVIAGLSDKDFVPGSALCFSRGVRIRLTFHCEPCKRIAHLVPSLSQLLLRRGILGVVTSDGKIYPDDVVSTTADAFEPLSTSPIGRFLFFLSQVPSGRVITYKDAVAGMGVAESYLRAIPGYVRRAPEGSPVHRVVDSNGLLISYVENQKQKLEDEGVIFSDHQAELSRLLFHGTSFEKENALWQLNLSAYRWCDPLIYTRS